MTESEKTKQEILDLENKIKLLNEKQAELNKEKENLEIACDSAIHLVNVMFGKEYL